LPAITVGSQSAEAARKTGFRKIRQAGGSVAALIDHVRGELSSREGPLLYLSGEETSGDIPGSLEAGGFKVDRVVLYAAQPALCLEPPAAEAVRNNEAGGVLLYSARSARVWAKCIAADNLIPYMEALLHYCLSPQVAEALPGEWRTVTANTADEDALLERIDGAGAAAARKV
jgi:uroporphyrinogen-III synthase